MTLSPFPTSCACLQALLLLPALTVPLFLPRPAAAATDKPTRTVDVYPANHERRNVEAFPTNSRSHKTDAGQGSRARRSAARPASVAHQDNAEDTVANAFVEEATHHQPSPNVQQTQPVHHHKSPAHKSPAHKSPARKSPVQEAQQTVEETVESPATRVAGLSLPAQTMHSSAHIAVQSVPVQAALALAGNMLCLPCLTIFASDLQSTSALNAMRIDSLSCMHKQLQYQAACVMFATLDQFCARVCLQTLHLT